MKFLEANSEEFAKIPVVLNNRLLLGQCGDTFPASERVHFFTLLEQLLADSTVGVYYPKSVDKSALEATVTKLFSDGSDSK